MKYGTRYCFGLPACVRRLLELLGERAEVVDRRLLHQLQHVGLGVLRGDLQLAADVVRRPAPARTPATAGPGPCGCRWRRTPCGCPARSRTFFISSISGPWSVPSSLQIVGWTHDSRLHFASTSGRVQRIWYMFAVGPPMSLMTPLNSGSAAIFSHFVEDRLLRPRLDDAALVGGDRAERAAAEAAAHDRDRVLDHLVRGDRLGVRRVRPARVRQVVDRGPSPPRDSGSAGGVDDDGLAVVELHQRRRR